MFPRLATAYGVTFLAFVLIDVPYLMTAGVPMFRAVLGEVLLQEPRLAPAILFYLLFPAGIVYFAGRPALADGSLVTAAVKGAAFGFFAYMTYELTNHATLRLWSWNLVVLDTLWGTFLTAASAVIGVAVARRVSVPPAA
jgi:uncharacterized membrane protein